MDDMRYLAGMIALLGQAAWSDWRLNTHASGTGTYDSAAGIQM